MTSLVDAIVEKYGPGDDESFDFIAVPRRRLESTSSENGKYPSCYLEDGRRLCPSTLANILLKKIIDSPRTLTFNE